MVKFRISLTSQLGYKSVRHNLEKFNRLQSAKYPSHRWLVECRCSSSNDQPIAKLLITSLSSFGIDYKSSKSDRLALFQWVLSYLLTLENTLVDYGLMVLVQRCSKDFNTSETTRRWLQFLAWSSMGFILLCLLVSHLFGRTFIVNHEEFFIGNSGENELPITFFHSAFYINGTQ
jgi:hypothetical protein